MERQHEGIDRNRVHQVTKGSGEQEKTDDNSVFASSEDRVKGSHSFLFKKKGK